MKLNVQKREKGQKPRALLNKGIIPAVLYGPKIKNEPIVVKFSDFQKVFSQAGETTLIDLDLGKEKIPALVHDVQKDPLTLEPVHIDFYSPRMDVVTRVKVPLVFEGEAPAVRDLGGVLVKSMQEIEVEALPKDLPHEIRVDVSKLKNIRDTLYISDLDTLPNVKILVDLKTPVATVIEIKVEKVEEAAPAPEATPPPTEREVNAAEKEKQAKIEGEEKTE